MSPGAWITLAIIAGAAMLLITEWLRPDVTALLVLLALGLTGVLTPAEAFSGFSQAAVITILSVFMLTAGLENTGVTRWIGQRLFRMTGASESRMRAALMLTASGLSLVMNTIAAAAVLLPTAMGVARQANLRPSRLLIPLAYASLLGGTATLLTTANIVVSTTLSQAGLQPFALFDFLPIGIPLILVGTAVVMLLAPHMLPERDMAGSIARMRRLQTELAQLYHLKEGTTQVQIKRGSAMAGQTLRQGGWGEDLGLTVLGVAHDGQMMLAPDRNTEVQEGDVVLLEGTPTPDQMERYGLRFSFDSELGRALASEDVPLVEVVLAPRAEYEGQSLRDIHFRERYGVQVLAIWREGLVLQHGLADLPLRFGDALLMQGPREKIDLLRVDPNWLVLVEETEGRPSRRAPLAVGILAVSLGLAAAGVLPIALATFSGAVLMVLTGCIPMEKAYRSVEWKAIFLIAGMLPLSAALQQTGAAAYLGQLLFQFTAGQGSLATAAVLLVSAITLSLLLSGQAAAVILAPIAIAAADLVGADARGLAMAVAVGCSLAFITPLGHPANLLVMAPGGYTFRDYLRIGAPLTLVAALTTLAGLHWVWGL